MNQPSESLPDRRRFREGAVVNLSVVKSFYYGDRAFIRGGREACLRKGRLTMAELRKENRRLTADLRGLTA